MRIVLSICLASLMISACHSEKESSVSAQIAILDDAFISMIDTVAYQYHNLRPAPNDSIYTDSNLLNVAMTPFLMSIRKWRREIAGPFLISENKTRILTLFEKSNLDSARLKIPVSLFKRTGRYKLFPYAKKSISIDTLSAIGKIEFSRTYFDAQYAITVATIRDHIKNGIVKLFLLEKMGGKWQKKEEHILEIW